jgi:hypothetical protein
METIRCIVKDDRISSINVGEFGTVRIDRTVMNTWYCIMFDETATRPALKTHYVEKEFKQFFEIVPQFDANILKLQQQIAVLKDSIASLYSSAHLKEELKSNLESQLADAVAQKRAYFDVLTDANMRH